MALYDNASLCLCVATELSFILQSQSSHVWIAGSGTKYLMARVRPKKLKSCKRFMIIAHPTGEDCSLTRCVPGHGDLSRLDSYRPAGADAENPLKP